MKYAHAFVPLMLCACAQSVDAPSLAPRPAEAFDVDAPAPPPPLLVAANPDQAALIAKLVAEARQGDTAFEKTLPDAVTTAVPMSEAWIAAQTARSAAEVARIPTLDALAAIDVAIGDAIGKGQDAEALVVARTKIQTLADRQSLKLDALSR